MGLVAVAVAVGAWARALAVPFGLLVFGAGVIALCRTLGVDRTWPAVLVGACAIGVAPALTVLIVATRVLRRHHRRTDGEGEPL